MSYSKEVINHFEKPRNVGKLDKNDPNVGTGLTGAPACLHGDTLVAVADGRQQVSIAQLCSEGKDVPVYCYKEDVGIVIHTAVNIRKTREKAPAVKVLFTNGSFLVCTPDHLIRTRARTVGEKWIEASKLTPGQSIMPFVRTTRRGYFHIYTKNGGRVPEHQMIWMAHNQKDIPSGHQVHHKNELKKDNSPSNLQLLTVEEHSRLHTTERLAGGWVPTGRDIKGRKNPMVVWWGAATPEEKKAYREKMSESTSLEKNGRWLEVSNEDLIEAGHRILKEEGLTASKWVAHAKQHKLPQNLSSRFGSFSSFKESCTNYNHTVERIEPYPNTDTYCLTVPETGNFCIITKITQNKSSGIVVHNCGDVMQLQIRVDPKTEVIDEVKFLTYGCGSAIASSSLITEWVKGRTLDEAMAIKNSQIVQELNLPPVKIHCSVLAEDAIKSAIADFRQKQKVPT